MPTLTEIVDTLVGVYEKLTSGLVPLVLLGALLALSAYHLSSHVRRRKRWQETATLLGLSHTAEDLSLWEEFQFLVSFYDLDGSRTRSLNVCTGESSGMKVWLLDHATGKKRRRFQTACIHRTDRLNLPHFQLFARTGLRVHRKYDVDLPDDPGFIRTFVLSGKDPEALRRFFDPMLRTRLGVLFARLREIERLYNDSPMESMLRIDSPGSLQLEASGDTVALHLSRLIAPRGAADLLPVADEITSLLMSCQDAARGDA
jgi:hypothetical protein